jgi:hypothetical protein
LAGEVIAELTSPYGFISNDGTDSLVYGEVQTRVVRSSVDQTIDFYWRIVPQTNPLGVPSLDGVVTLARVTTDSFNSSFYADFRSDLPGAIAPTRYFGPVPIGLSRDFHEFYFPTPVSVGNPSRWFFLDSNANQFRSEGASVTIEETTGGFGSQTVRTYGPTIPEPTAPILTILAVVAVAGRNRASH